MKKSQLNWFDRMMIGVTFAEANVAEPDLSHIRTRDKNKQSPLGKKEDEYESFDVEVVPAQ